MGTYASITGPIRASANHHLPGFGYNLSVMAVNTRTEAWMFLEKMRLYAVGDDLSKSGFFASDAEESDNRHHAYEHSAERLNNLRQNALAEATQTRSFDKLCEHLAVDPH